MKPIKLHKDKWPKIKERIVNALKFLSFTIIMIMGFWLIFYTGWITIGLPQNTVALWLTFIQALVSECLYIKWISN